MNLNYHIPKTVILMSILLIFILKSVAQTDSLIEGVITDKSTGKPIPHVEIFISGTTRGCISDNQGKFTLKVPYFPCTLVADHVSYDAYIQNLDGTQINFKIELNPANISINEIRVTGKNNRRKNMRYFYSHFISKNKREIEILNDSVLIFSRNIKEFIASTNKPLIIMNKILGYKIRLILKRFSVYKTEFPGGPGVPLSSSKGKEFMQVSGYYYYEPLKTASPQQRLEYIKNRRSFYFGSDRHFLKALYNGTLNQQGFQLEVFPEKYKHAGIKQVENFDNGLGGKKYFIDADSIKVTYTFGKDKYPYTYSLLKNTNHFDTEVSTIYRTNDIFTIWKNGTSPDVNFIIIGPMASGTNFANSLPKDYKPF